MDKIFEKSILYDLYGGLLNTNQRTVYEYHVLDDLTFSEIGEEIGITRQAAYELYKVADKKLLDIDKKLKLSERFKDIEKDAKEIKSLCKGNQKIINLANKIIKKTLREE
ncbi:MAG: transcriptional regulator [Lachnospiraceae bacterium]|nr:transcriptional regulator [Lachnospiraceae bacterium]